MSCQAFSRNIGPALIAWFLLIALTSMYLFFICWEFSHQTSYSLIIAHSFLITYVVCTFGRATFMDPGYLPVGNASMVCYLRDLPTPQMLPLFYLQTLYRCKCSFLSRLILQTFDHHCPWLNNCIGKRNYRYFLAFLLSLTAHMLITFGISVTFVLMRTDRLSSYPVIIAYPLLV
ncbi:unnamed protein product [Echinostoma caproni]|uniref:Palmitoyltransferase n=1 Tax=Echinostoma caproni TaxID=27848 RepID=A0A183B0I2_9TREM|nr:unnamed protein product [Echinostoma caproni]